MVEAEAHGGAAQAGPLEVDPFALYPDRASRIAGLGGSQRSEDLVYIFHTNYVEAATGNCHFNVEFAGLTAKTGTLVLHVHMFPLNGGHARVATSDRILFNRLVQQGGRISVKFEAFRGYSYALHGSLLGDTDAAASGVRMYLDRPFDPAAEDDHFFDARTTSFGRDSARGVAHLVSLESASLKYPVAQLCTASQLREPAFREWMRLLGPPGEPQADWAAVYVLQVLRAYGVLQNGAIGLDLGHGDPRLPGIVAGLGPDVVVVSEGEAALPSTPAKPTKGQVEYREASLAPLARDLLNFDFLWSVGTAAAQDSVAEGVRFLDAAMSALRPGGLAVHVMPLDLDSSGERPEQAPAPFFRRKDMEKVALILISRNHEVAQIKIDARNAPAATYRADDGTGTHMVGAFGLIARRAPSTF